MQVHKTGIKCELKVHKIHFFNVYHSCLLGPTYRRKETALSNFSDIMWTLHKFISLGGEKICVAIAKKNTRCFLKQKFSLAAARLNSG